MTTRRTRDDHAPTQVGEEAGRLLAKFIREADAAPVRGLTPEQVVKERDKFEDLRWQIRHLSNERKIHIELRTKSLRNSSTNKPCRIVITGMAHADIPAGAELLFIVTPVDVKTIADGDDRCVACLMKRLNDVIDVAERAKERVKQRLSERKVRHDQG